MTMVSDKLLVTSGPSGTDDIILWEINEDEDVITQVKTHTGQRSSNSDDLSVAANPGTDGQVAKGSLLENLIVMNLETGKVLWTNKAKDKPCQPLASIDYIDDYSLLVCNASNGHLHIIDTRSPSPPCSSSILEPSGIEWSGSSESEKPSGWSCSVNFQSRHRRVGKDFKGGRRQMAAVLSPSGLVNIHDLRDVNKRVCSVTKGSRNSVCVRWSLNQGNFISVSDWDHCVRIYDISSFENKVYTKTLAEPVFVHYGHNTELQESGMWLTTHIW